MGERPLVCCACGGAINNGTIVRYQLERYDLVCHASGQGRVLTVDAAIACSTGCLATYLTNELEASTHA